MQSCKLSQSTNNSKNEEEMTLAKDSSLNLVEKNKQPTYGSLVYSMLIKYEKHKLENEIRQTQKEEESKQKEQQEKQIQQKYNQILQSQMNSRKNTEQKRKLIYNMITRVLRAQLKKKLFLLSKFIEPKNSHKRESITRYYDIHYSQVISIMFVKLYVSPYENCSFSKKKVRLLTKDKMLKNFLQRFLCSQGCTQLFRKLNQVKHEQTSKTFLQLVQKYDLDYACKKLTFDPKRFSKIPWLETNFEKARQEFVNDFMQNDDIILSEFK